MNCDYELLSSFVGTNPSFSFWYSSWVFFDFLVAHIAESFEWHLIAVSPAFSRVFESALDCSFYRRIKVSYGITIAIDQMLQDDAKSSLFVFRGRKISISNDPLRDLDVLDVSVVLQASSPEVLNWKSSASTPGALCRSYLVRASPPSGCSSYVRISWFFKL